jgi:uncharacterized phage protein (predicted DNA packaging)
MPNLVTLAEAKLFCRVDADDEDATFEILIAAASEAVCEIATDWDGTVEIPARLKLAALTRIAAAFDERESVVDAGKGEDRLLLPLRRLDI